MAQNNSLQKTNVERESGEEIKSDKIEDEMETVPLLENQHHNGNDFEKGEKNSGSLNNENTLPGENTAPGEEDQSENDNDYKRETLKDGEASHLNGESNSEACGFRHDFIKVIQLPIGSKDYNETYEFRNEFAHEMINLANETIDDNERLNDGRLDHGLDIDTESDTELRKECQQLQMSQDYDFLIQSLDASSFANLPKLNLNTASTSCEDALSILGMKKSINEQIDSLNYFEFLPAEIIVYIFSFLATFELCRHVAPVCRQWRQLSMDQSLWKCTNFTSFKHLDSLNLLWVVRRAPLLQKLVIRGRTTLTVAEIAIITESCPGLQDLDLGFCDPLNCDMIQYIVKNCKKLRRINVEGCEKVDSKCIRLLTRCETLTHFNFSHCLLSDSTLKYLCKNARCIVNINLDGIPYTTDSMVVAMVNKHIDCIQEVELDGAEISDESLMYLSKCSNLKRLSISFCECLTDQGLVYLKNLKNLEVLRLRKGTDFTVDGLNTFFHEADLRKLHSLNLSECSEITDAVVLEMVKSCGEHLQELALSWCWFVTEKGLISIVDHCSKLQVLDVLGIDKITGECLTRVPDEMPFLRFLDLEQCNKIVDSLIYDVVRRKPDLQVLNYYGEKFVHGDEIPTKPDQIFLFAKTIN